MRAFSSDSYYEGISDFKPINQGRWVQDNEILAYCSVFLPSNGSCSAGPTWHLRPLFLSMMACRRFCYDRCAPITYCSRFILMRSPCQLTLAQTALQLRYHGAAWIPQWLVSLPSVEVLSRSQPALSHTTLYILLKRCGRTYSGIILI